MKNKLYIFVLLLLTYSSVFARENEKFSDAEENFKLVMQKLSEHYIDNGLSREELYRAATAGMLESLNSGEQAWNKLLSPMDLSEIKADLSGQVTGIGVEMKFDEGTGYAQVLRVIPKSPGEKAGMKKDDQILSVDGKRYKGKSFHELVSSVRGKTGSSVALKVLREDKIVDIKVKRAIIPWTPVELTQIDDKTALLAIGYFTEETPSLVKKEIEKLNQKKVTRLIIDLRGNSGGGFDQAVQVAELFVPKGNLVVSTMDRSGKIEKFQSRQGLLDQNIQLIALTDKATFSGAELVVASLKESCGAKVVGDPTFGKWNAQTIETLPNGFAVKYTVKSFVSPLGNSYQGEGLKPDLQVSLPKEMDPRELRLKYGVVKRLNIDTQLRAAYELAKAN